MASPRGASGILTVGVFAADRNLKENLIIQLDTALLDIHRRYTSIPAGDLPCAKLYDELFYLLGASSIQDPYQLEPLEKNIRDQLTLVRTKREKECSPKKIKTQSYLTLFFLAMIFLMREEVNLRDLGYVADRVEKQMGIVSFIALLLSSYLCSNTVSTSFKRDIYLGTEFALISLLNTINESKENNAQLSKKLDSHDSSALNFRKDFFDRHIKPRHARLGMS